MTVLSERQATLETRGLLDGERRYVARVAKAYGHDAASHAAPVRHLLAVCLDWLEADLALRADEILAERGVRPAWLVWVERVGPDVAAYLTLRAALNGVGVAGGLGLRAVATSLVRMLVDEVRAKAFRAANESAYANAVNHRRGVTRGARSDRLLARMRYHGIEIPPAPGPAETMLVGSQLLAIMVDVTGLFTLDRAPSDARRRRWKLRLKPEQTTLDWIAARDKRLRLTMPLHPPCVVPPKDWGPGVAGGYHFDLAGSLPLVRRASRAQDLALQTEPMPLVYSALNTLQRTPWRVNRRILPIVRLALDGKLPNLLPSPHDDPVPARPAEDAEVDAVRAWRRAAADVHQSNGRRRGRRADAERALVVAEQVAEDERIYFPYTLDFRGRAYPAVEFLHPHGPDLVRGLLEFADGVELTKVGVGWLAVHGANTLGVCNGQKLSRLNFQERVDVIKSLSDKIVDAADDPFTHQWWIQADEPWQFLAFCLEWAEWTQTGRLVSRIPVTLDGTCNGLQHFSAMLRDPVGAAAVNLIDSDRPSDIYGQVADDVSATLSERYVTEPMAHLWLLSQVVTRQLVKRPVMTLAYGATRYGFVDQLLETLRSKEALWTEITKVCRSRTVRVREACQYLSAMLWDVLQSVVGGALSAMQWLQASADAVSSVTGGPVYWSVPMTGFPARMEYWKPKRSQVKTLMSGTIIQPSVFTPTSTPLQSKIRNAISPNVVHSLDAACMQATTVACAARGVTSFTMVHDCYGAHAEFIPTVADALRTVFIELYRRDILRELATYWRSLGAEIPEPPALGEFDLNEVRHARFFFS